MNRRSAKRSGTATIVRFSSGVLAASVMLVACGGSGGPSDRLSDTWLWNGSDWAEVHSTTYPPPRDEATVAYDGASQQVVLFGGKRDGQMMNDTWTWDGRSWTLQHPKTSPSPRFGAVMVYDAAHGVLIMIGGLGDSPSFTPNEMWAWDGSEWRLLSVPAPFSGLDVAFGYDPATHRVVAAVPCCIGNTVTWTWSGSSWTQAAPPQELTGHFDFVYADRTSGRLTAIAALGQTFVDMTEHLLTWNGANWMMGPEIAVPKKTGILGPTWPAGFAYDVQNGLLVAFGGRSCQGSAWDETWTWDGTSWNLVQPQHRPPGRSSAYMAFEATRGTVMMFGGDTSNGCGGIGA